MPDAEILKAAPQFELPSGLPEGPWDLFEDDDGFWSVASAGLLLVDTVTDEQIARAIAAIPAMVEEIGRLRTELANIKADYLRRHKDACDRFAEIVELKGLNAELREALRQVVVADDAAFAELEAMNFGFKRSEENSRITELCRAILAKCESQSATMEN